MDGDAANSMTDPVTDSGSDSNAAGPSWNSEVSATFYFYLVLWVLPAIVSLIYFWGFSSSYREQRIYCWHRLLECRWTPTRYLRRQEEEALEARRARRLARKQKRMAAEAAIREQLANYTMRLREEDIFEDEDMDTYKSNLKEEDIEKKDVDDSEKGAVDQDRDQDGEKVVPVAGVAELKFGTDKEDGIGGPTGTTGTGDRKSNNERLDDADDDDDDDDDIIDDTIDDDNFEDTIDQENDDDDLKDTDDQAASAPLPMIDDENGTICLPCAGFRLGCAATDRRDSGEHSGSASNEGEVAPTPTTPSFQTIANVPKDKLRRAPNGCSVCLCEFDAGDAITWACNSACSHVFHYDCILHWFESVGKKQRHRRQTALNQWQCPCCRQTFAIQSGITIRRRFDHIDGILLAAGSAEERRNSVGIGNGNDNIEDTNDHDSDVDDSGSIDHTGDLESGFSTTVPAER